MLAHHQVAEVRELERRGFSQRAISRATGLARETVRRILGGRRPEYAPRRGRPEDAPFSGPPRRCPRCGGLVLMPCLACHVRQLVNVQRNARRSCGSSLAAEPLDCC